MTSLYGPFNHYGLTWYICRASDEQRINRKVSVGKVLVNGSGTTPA